MEVADYPERGALISETCEAFKASRAPLSEEANRYGPDRKTRQLVGRLARRLSEHLYFEHHPLKELADVLFRAVADYRGALEESPRPKAKVLATECLDALSRPPTEWLGFFGIEHLDLPTGTEVGGIRFLHSADEPGLDEALSPFGASAPTFFCSATVVAGTADIALMRARRDAESAIALIRQQVLHGFRAKMYPEQLAFRLSGHWAWKHEGRFDLSGWWLAERHPIDMDMKEQPDWLTSLHELAEQRDALSEDLRGRVDTALDWLDVAARSESGRIKLPAIYSAMEALLVPEDSGRKAGAVTVRSVAVHVALAEGFSNPFEAFEGYFWRNRLIHGAPTHDANDEELLKLAEDREIWAFRLFVAYLRLSTRHGFENIRRLISYLDKEHGDQVCEWLLRYGGVEVIEEYRDMLTVGKTRS